MYLWDEMNGFNNWRGLKRPFHNDCLPRLDHSGEGGRLAGPGWRRPSKRGEDIKAGITPYINWQAGIVVSGRMLNVKRSYATTCILCMFRHKYP